MPRPRKQNTAPDRAILLTPEEEATIDSADEAALRRMHEAAATEESATEAALKADADVTSARLKLKELMQPYRDNIKAARAKRRRCYERLEQLGKE